MISSLNKLDNVLLGSTGKYVPATAVVKRLECLKPKSKAVSSNRNCVGKKRQVHRKNLIIVSEVSSSCCIPLSGETDLAEEQNS